MKKSPQKKNKLVYYQTNYFLGFLPISRTRIVRYYENQYTALKLFQSSKRAGENPKLYKFWRGKWYLDLK